MADIRPIDITTPVQVDSVNNTQSVDTSSTSSIEDVSVASTEYWYEQAKYYAGQSAQSASVAENAKNTLLSDAGFIAVSQDLTNINIVATNINDVNTVATSIADVNAVADDLTNIGIIATDLSDEDSILKSVSDNITYIYSVASDLDNIDAVYDGLTNIDTVVTNISDINTVATNISDINAVADNATNISAVADNETNINSVADNATNINAVAANETNINAVNSNSANINTVAGGISNISTVATNISSINAVNNDLTKINGVYSDLSVIDAVYSNASNINTVSSNISDIQTVVTNITDIQNAEENATLASQSATNAATSEDNAEIWAEGTDTQVSDLGGTHSAKGWANYVMNALSNYVPYSSATQEIDINNQNLKNVNNLSVNGTVNATTDIQINGVSVLTGITSTMVTTALGYTPYSAANPNGYTSNTGTVTSVNNISPSSGNVTLTASDVGALSDSTTIPSALGDLSNVTISNPTQGQNLTYDAINQVWKNTSTSATIAWGGITGTLSAQTDLQNALNNRYVIFRKWSS